MGLYIAGPTLFLTLPSHLPRCCLEEAGTFFPAEDAVRALPKGTGMKLPAGTNCCRNYAELAHLGGFQGSNWECTETISPACFQFDPATQKYSQGKFELVILRPLVWDLVLVFLATAKYHVFPQLLPHMTPINSLRILPMLHLWRPWRVWALDAVRSLGAWSAAQHLPGCWQDPAIFSPNAKRVFRVKKQIKKSQQQQRSQ